MATIVEQHEIEDGFRVLKLANSSRWYATFKVGDNWVRNKATKQRELSAAILKAVELRAQHRAYLASNTNTRFSSGNFLSSA